MSNVNILHQLRHLFYLNRVMANRKKRPNRARFWLDKALAIEDGSDIYSWVLGADGIHKVNEDKLADARESFARCREHTRRNRNNDERYVFAFSELWLAIGDTNVGYERIRELGLLSHSASKNASAFVRQLLPLSSMDTLEEVCGAREIDEQPSFTSRPESRIGTVSTQFDF